MEESLGDATDVVNTNRHCLPHSSLSQIFQSWAKIHGHQNSPSWRRICLEIQLHKQKLPSMIYYTLPP